MWAERVMPIVDRWAVIVRQNLMTIGSSFGATVLRQGCAVLVSLGTLSCSPALWSDQAATERTIHVLRVSAAEVDSTASVPEGADKICEGWTLTASQAERFFALSKEVDSRTYHHTYDTMPCKIGGVVSMDGKVWQFTINGAAKAQLIDGVTVRILGCEAKQCEPVVMEPFVDPLLL